MNRDPANAGGANPPIDLAHETAFALGTLTVDPATRTVSAGVWSQRLEPRAMQVLVLLARVSPAVVGRSDLNVRVWGGRVVGEDAINRAVQTLRRMAADAPAPLPFTITTIPRVGYSLVTGIGVEADEAKPLPVTPSDTPTRARWHRLRLPAAVLLILTMAAAVWLWPRREPVKPVAWKIVDSRTLDDLLPDAMDLAMSPDGRRLAYGTPNGEGRETLFVRAMEGGGVGIPVSPAGIDARHPAWSPDGTTLAFVAFEAGQPCRLYLLRRNQAAIESGRCETAREPRLTWSADGRSLLLGDAPGENGVLRITALSLGDGKRSVLSSPPGDSMGDNLPISRHGDIVFQRTFGWADEGWIARDPATGGEHLLWRRRGVAGSAAATLPNGALAIAWTQAGASGLDVVNADGGTMSQPIAIRAVSAMSASGSRLLLEAERSENQLFRAGKTGSSGSRLASVRGRIAGPAALADGRILLPVSSAGVARIWERDAAGSLHPWGSFGAVRISGLAPSVDGRFTAGLVTGAAGREIMLFDATGKPVFRWNPHARSVNPAAWSADGRTLIVPVLDGSGWRLFAVDPFHGDRPRDIERLGFAVVQNAGAALYAVRAGENTGIRELWRLDGRVRRLPIDLTLLDIVNWRPFGEGIWLPDRSDRARPMLVLRNINTGGILRRLPAPGLAWVGAGLTADGGGPIYVRMVRDVPEYSVLNLALAGQ